MIDFKGVKKVRSDDNSTELVHPKGHKIIIAHKALSSKMKKQLDELPHYSDGGTPGLHDDYSQGEKTIQAQQSYTGQKATVHQDSDQEYNQRKKDFGADAPRLTLPAGMADGGEVELNLNQQMPMKQPLYQSVGPNAQYSDQFGYESENAPEKSNNLTNIQLSQEPQQQQTIPPVPNVPMASYESQLGQMAQGQQREAAAVGAQGKQEARAAQEQQSQMQALQDNYQQKSQEIDSERTSLYNDLKNGHVEPQHYLQSLSGFGQAMTAIGVALGGYGAGINGGSNHAMDFLNRQIDRDIEGQKMELGKKQNMLSVLNQQMGNLRDATIMSKALQMDMYSTKMQELAAQSKDPIAQARAQQMIAQMHLQYEPQIQQLKMSQAALAGIQQGSIPLERAIPFFVPKEQQKEALHSAGKLEDLNKNQGTILNYFDQAAKDNTIARTGAGVLRTPASVTALQSMMLPVLRDSAGAIREFEFNNVQNMLPKPGDMDSTVSKKRQLFINFLNQKRNEEESTLKGFGLPPPKAPSTKFKPRES